MKNENFLNICIAIGYFIDKNIMIAFHLLYSVISYPFIFICGFYNPFIRKYQPYKSCSVKEQDLENSTLLHLICVSISLTLYVMVYFLIKFPLITVLTITSILLFIFFAYCVYCYEINEKQEKIEE